MLFLLSCGSDYGLLLLTSDGSSVLTGYFSMNMARSVVMRLTEQAVNQLQSPEFKPWHHISRGESFVSGF